MAPNVEDEKKKKAENKERRRRNKAGKKELSEERKRLKELRKYANDERYKTDYSLTILAEALNIEHEESSKQYRRYNQENVNFTLVSQNEYTYNSNCFDIPRDIESLSLSIKQMDSDESTRFTGKIVLFNSGIGKVFFTTSFELKTSLSYSITFQVDRRITNACLRALKRVENYGLTNFFTKFDDKFVDTKKKRNIKPPSKWFNKKIPEDAAQKSIVLNILSESAYPYPFVITGGPGTGKSSVIVETILQILDKKSFAHVLVTCQSNSACDEIAMRLRIFVPAVKVFRYWGYVAAMKKIEHKENRDSYYEKLIENSSIVDRKYVDPTLENFIKYKVVVATMTAVNWLIKNDFPKDHFDFIFVDECCAATEPESLIPITGLGMDRNKVNANIILVGDEHLLGPVLNSRLAAGLGLEQSLLERIMRLDLYNPETSKRVVKLTNNYRSHPEIFKYSNETFYNSSMEQMVSVEDHNFAKNWNQLPNKDIPVIFHSVEGEAVEIKEYDGDSKFNLEEVEQIFEYVQNLVEVGLSSNKKVKQDQIGIASPFTAQVKKLRERLSDDYPFIDVGTTEFFQSREKPVMIISAVRTKKDRGAGNFMDNPRRLNVLLTRAKSLMIIVGNLNKLHSFFPWQSFIENCIKNGLVRKGDLNDDGIIERVHALQINDALAGESKIDVNESTDEEDSESDTE